MPTVTDQLCSSWPEIKAEMSGTRYHLKNVFFKEENAEWCWGGGGGEKKEDKSKEWHYWIADCKNKKYETVRLWETYFWD